MGVWAEEGIYRVAEDLKLTKPEDILLARLDSGLFHMQQAAIIIGHLWETKYMPLRKRLLTLLHSRGHSLGFIRELLLEYLINIGSNDFERRRGKEKTQIRYLLQALGVHDFDMVVAEQQ